MTRDELKQWIVDEITLSGALQVNLPEKEIDRIIDRELAMLYEINGDALYDSFTIIPVQYFYETEFKNNRTIQFPDCVHTVTKFVEIKRRAAFLGTNDYDFSYNKLLFGGDFYSGVGMSTDFLANRTIQWSTWDQLKRFTLVDIQHTWNPVNHQLSVQGHSPTTNVYVGLKVKVKEEDIFDDIRCRNWIAAHCKLAVVRLLSLFSTNLIGGVSINTQAYADEASKTIEECQTWFRQTNTITWFATIP